MLERNKESLSLARALWPAGNVRVSGSLPLYMIRAKVRHEMGQFKKENRDHTLLGGYQPVNKDRWQDNMRNQPEWRKKFIAQIQDHRRLCGGATRATHRSLFLPSATEIHMAGVQREATEKSQPPELSKASLSSIKSTAYRGELSWDPVKVYTPSTMRCQMSLVGCYASSLICSQCV